MELGQRLCLRPLVPLGKLPGRKTAVNLNFWAHHFGVLSLFLVLIFLPLGDYSQYFGFFLEMCYFLTSPYICFFSFSFHSHANKTTNKTKPLGTKWRKWEINGWQLFLERGTHLQGGKLVEEAEFSPDFVPFLFSFTWAPLCSFRTSTHLTAGLLESNGVICWVRLRSLY